MPKFVAINRVKQAIEHLQKFDSNWVIVPLVLSANGVNSKTEVDIRSEGRAGGDKFLALYFDGSLIGLPPFPNGLNTLRPRFKDILSNIQKFGGPDDYVYHQGTGLWANAYSSRGYREMRKMSLLGGEYSKFTLEKSFTKEWLKRLPGDFRFEELLVWLYALSGIPDNVKSWTELQNNFESRHLGPGKHLEPEYTSRFKISNDIPWPASFLKTAPSNEQWQKELLPSRTVQAKQSKDLSAIVLEFATALAASGLSFGERHEEVSRTFLASAVTKPFVILTGLSGSGKSGIAIRFGEWLGNDRSLVVPVRPDWTSGEALFGYSNALDLAVPPSWIVTSVLKFVLRAASDPGSPYLLVLDEMNLAHVERYFGDFLSGMESRKEVIPNLVEGADNKWRSKAGSPERIPVPSNLFVMGTVNVDETTYMFSPKVLDRANSIEFRVTTDELNSSAMKPSVCGVGDKSSVDTLLQIMRSDDFQEKHPATYGIQFTEHLQMLHRILSEGGFEFGHRVFYEAIRFAACYEAAGGASWEEALDFQVYQKILPRLHGSQKRLSNTIRAIAQFCFDPSKPVDEKSAGEFDPEKVGAVNASLRRSFEKLRRMHRDLRTNHFTSFTG